MKSVKSSPQIYKSKDVNTNALRRVVSAEALSDMYELYQSFTVAKASLESIPCIISATTAKHASEQSAVLQMGVCLATPPDVSCSSDENITVEVKPPRRKDSNPNDDEDICDNTGIERL